MHIYLKVKIKSLTDEARHIREMEHQFNIGHRARTRLRRCIALESKHVQGNLTNRQTLSPAQIERMEKKLLHARRQLRNGRAQAAFSGLREHRKNDVRKEARSSFIAYGFLRGKTLNQIEQSDKPVDWDRVEALVKKFGEEDIRVMLQRLAEWKDADKIDPELNDIAHQIMY